MANRILLQTLLRFSDQIKSGAAKVQDVVTDYFNQTGKSVTDEERSIILNEFAKSAPANVTPLKSRAFDEIDETAESFDPDYMRGTSDTDVTAGELRGRINYPLMEKQLGVKLRGNETFEELLEIEKNTKESKQGLGSLFPKGEPGSIFDQKNSNRMEVAAFMRAMREAGIKNEDVMEVIKDKTDFKRQPAYEFFGSDKPKEVVDLAEGKRAATTLARAADMAADTKIKQELLANLDDDIANYGPDWWKGMGYNEGPMGRESVGNLLESMTTEINNGVIDDLVAAGMEEDKVFEIMRYMGRDVRERLKFDPKGFIRKVAEELEFNDIKYDMTFWDNYVDEILTRIQKPEPRFAHGGLV
jgi:hypothetical protein